MFILSYSFSRIQEDAREASEGRAPAKEKEGSSAEAEVEREAQEEDLSL